MKRFFKFCFLITIILFFYGCPQAAFHKYIKVGSSINNDNNNFIIYKNDSIKFNISYVHFFGNKERNMVLANLTFLTKKSIKKSDYKISIRSLKFGSLDNVKIPSKYNNRFKNHYHLNAKTKIDTNTIYQFNKIVGTKNSLRKLKKDTITLTINNKKSYWFTIPI